MFTYICIFRSIRQYCIYFNSHGSRSKLIKSILRLMGLFWIFICYRPWWKLFCSKRYIYINIYIVGSNILLCNNRFYYKYFRNFWASRAYNAFCYCMLDFYISRLRIKNNFLFNFKNILFNFKNIFIF